MENIDPRLLDGLSSTDSEAEAQPTIVRAEAEAQEPFFNHSPQDDGYLFQSYVPNYCPPYTDFASPYPEEPLIESGFNFNFFNPDTSNSGPAAPNFMFSTYPHAPVPIAYPYFAAPPFPAPLGPAQVQTSTPGANESSTRKSQSKKQGRKSQLVRGKGVNKPLLGEEVTKLSKPLSQLALESPHIPPYDIDAYILRDANKRRSRNGRRVGRPNNAFVLYRRAYCDQIKAMMGTTQNFVVSRIAGASWQMEDPSVKEKFNQYAAEEKRQHYVCFPGYRYTPKARRTTRRSEA